MTVLDLLSGVDRDYLAARMNELCGTEDARDLIDVALAFLESAQPEKTGIAVLVRPSKMEDDTFDVDGLTTNGSTIALDFMPWGAWREFSVDIEGWPLTDLAALILDELTWHGMPDEQAARRDEVNKLMTKLDMPLSHKFVAKRKLNH